MSSVWHRRKEALLEAFVAVNLAVLALDIHLAHSVNRFRHWAEWIPFWFSIAAAPCVALTTLLALRGKAPGLSRRLGLSVGWLSVLVGVAGMALHLEDQFFRQFTLASLVYAAPFVAPLSYAGIGLLLILNRQVAPGSRAWGQWVVFLALGGFVGCFVLALADHEQNGFFHPSEWIPVGSSAFVVAFLALALTEGGRERGFLIACLVVLGVQALVGVAGFVLHLQADVNGISASRFENFVHGAPVMAPLLLANLFLLGVIGIVDALVRPASSAVPG